MSQNDDLRDCLRALAEVLPREAGSSVQQRLVSRFRERRDKRRRRAYIAGAVASAILAVGLYVGLSHGRIGKRGVPATINDQSAGFITLPYAQSGVPLEQPVIVRVNIPVSDLGLMGVGFTSTGATDRVRADLLIGQDGVARAVRLIE